VRYEVRHSDDEGASTGVIIGLKRRETIVSLVQTSVRYAAYGVAIFFTVVQLAGLGNSNGALAGASLIVVLIGFALQRFLIDILTGFFMQFEGWFSIGDSITVEPYGLAGIVEETSLRSTKLRALSGELLYVHNSQLLAARVLPRGLREVSIELFLRDEDRGVALFEQAARVMPIGPTEFVRPPWIESIQTLDSARLATEVSRCAAKSGRDVAAMVEVNTSGEPTKYGVAAEKALELVREIQALPGIRLSGLMTIGPLDPDPERARPSFRLLRELRNDIERTGIPLRELSMGMTNDFEVAIEEGSTMVRIGTAIFGSRNVRATGELK